jgi:hypothetical protein
MVLGLEERGSGERESEPLKSGTRKSKSWTETSCRPALIHSSSRGALSRLSAPSLIIFLLFPTGSAAQMATYQVRRDEPLAKGEAFSSARLLSRSELPFLGGSGYVAR